MSRSRSSCIAWEPQRFRHIGSALSIIAEKSAAAGVSKNTSPAAIGNADERKRHGSADASVSTSRWLE